MNDLAGRLSSMSPERRAYLLLSLPQQLFKARRTARLRQSVCERAWFQAQIELDASYQSYAAGLDLVIDACEGVPSELPGLIFASLLRATLNTLVSKVPAAALETMARGSSTDQALFFADQHTDPVLHSESLCSLALVLAGRGDLHRANEILESAKEAAGNIPDQESRLEAKLAIVGVSFQVTGDQNQAARGLHLVAGQVPTISDQRRQTHLQAYIARIASLLGEIELEEQSILAIRHAYQRSHKLTPKARRALNLGDINTFGQARGATWDVAKFAIDFKLLDSPADLILLAQWDGERSSY